MTDFHFLPSQLLGQPMVASDDGESFNGWNLQQPHSASFVSGLFPWDVPQYLLTFHVYLKSVVAKMNVTSPGQVLTLVDSKVTVRYGAMDGSRFTLQLVSCPHSY